MRICMGTLLGLVLSTGALALGSETLIGIDTSTGTGSQWVYQIDPTTGASVHIGTITGAAQAMGGLTYDAATDTLYGSSTGSSTQAYLYTINRSTWVATPIGRITRTGHFSTFMHGLEFYPPDNTLLGMDTYDDTLVRIDPATAAVTAIGATPVTGSSGIAWDASAGKLFASEQSADGLWELDPATGAGTFVGPFNAPADQIGSGMAWSPTYGLLAVNNNLDDSLWSINTVTGAATLIGNTGTGNVITLAFVPEPSSIVALVMCSVLAFRRR